MVQLAMASGADEIFRKDHEIIIASNVSRCHGGWLPFLREKQDPRWGVGAPFRILGGWDNRLSSAVSDYVILWKSKQVARKFSYKGEE